MIRPFRSALTAVLLLAVTLGASAVQAQVQAQVQVDTFPSRPLRIIVGPGPGSNADTLARAFAEMLAGQLKQPVIVENRPGADGALGIQAMLNAPADGYTLALVSAGAMVLNPLTVPGLPYKASDIQPLFGMVRSTGILAAGPNSKFGSLQELLRAARKDPGLITMGDYLPIYRASTRMLEIKSGARFNYVAYKAFGPLSVDLMAGTIESGILDAGAAAPLVQAGKMRPFAVTSTRRLPSMPDVPTVREAGFPDFDSHIWVGMGIHPKTPEAVVKRLESEALAVMATPAWQALLARLVSMETWPLTGKELADVLVGDTDFFRKALDLPGARP